MVEADGQRIAATAASGTLAVGDRTVVYVRPESLRIQDRPAAPDATTLRATVVRSAFLGDSTEYILALSDDVDWHLRLEHATRLTVGEEVNLGALRAGCRAFALAGSAEDGSPGVAPREP